MVIEMNKSIMIGTATALLSIFLLLLLYLTPYTYQKSGDRLLRVNRFTGTANLYAGDQWLHVMSPKEVAALEREKEKEKEEPIFKLNELLYGEGVADFDNIESFDGLYRLSVKRGHEECKAGITVYEGKTNRQDKSLMVHFQQIGNELVQCQTYPYKLFNFSKDLSIAFPWARKGS
jgi:hypothetical protein